MLTADNERLAARLAVLERERDAAVAAGGGGGGGAARGDAVGASSRAWW